MSARSTESPATRRARKKAYLAVYYQANKERARLNAARWKAEHPEQRRATRLAYMKVHSERVRAKQREWQKANKERLSREAKAKYAANPTRQKERSRKWSADNPEAVKANKRAHYLANKKKILAKTSAWAKSHPEIVLATARRWRRNHPDKVKEKSRIERIKFRTKRRAAQIKRRSMLKTVEVGNIAVISQWEKRWRRAKSVTCYWCLGLFSGKVCHSDHIIPLARGGVHGIGNLCVSCGPCNLRKHAKSPQSWERELQSPTLLTAA